EEAISLRGKPREIIKTIKERKLEYFGCDATPGKIWRLACEASCVTEMALMMACWKANEFSDGACAKEITTFFECVAKAEAKKKETTPEEFSMKPKRRTLLKDFFLKIPVF
uniref:CHCH domain-containing protein n=1 Tax=Pseudonaja textilis TaxID=8673 RepID=A0A670ZY07_PSETE